MIGDPSDSMLRQDNTVRESLQAVVRTMQYSDITRTDAGLLLDTPQPEIDGTNAPAFFWPDEAAMIRYFENSNDSL